MKEWKWTSLGFCLTEVVTATRGVRGMRWIPNTKVQVVSEHQGALKSGRIVLGVFTWEALAPKRCHLRYLRSLCCRVILTLLTGKLATLAHVKRENASPSVHVSVSVTGSDFRVIDTLAKGNAHWLFILLSLLEERLTSLLKAMFCRVVDR